MIGGVDGVAAKQMWVHRGSRLYSKNSQILGAQHPAGKVGLRSLAEPAVFSP